MADTTIKKMCAVVVATNSESSLTLDSDRLYSIFHTGFDNAGGAETDPVFAQCDGETAVATYAALSGKLIIQSGQTIQLPPGATTVKFITSSATVALQVLPSEKKHGGIA